MLEKYHSMRYGVSACFVNVLGAAFGLCLYSYSALAAESYTVLALGDSLTAGYGLPQSDSFPRQLESALRAQGHDITIINGGVSGDTSAGGRARLDWLLNKDVRAVIIELGANDGLRGIDPVETRKNLSWILGHLKELQIKVLLTGMKAPPNLGKDYGHDFNSIYTDLARQFSVAFDPFYLQDVAAVEHLNQADGIHPNARGVAKIVQRLSPQIVKLLSQKKPTP